MLFLKLKSTHNVFYVLGEMDTYTKPDPAGRHKVFAFALGKILAGL